MHWRTKILEEILSGLKRACFDAIEFSEDFARKIDAEYLLTVNVAKSIVTLNQGIGFPLRVILEHRTSRFTTACVPLIGYVPAANFMGRQSIIRKPHDTSRRGRIDIAVMHDLNGIEAPVCAIELKGFNPGRRHVIKDLTRNLEYFQVIDETGRSRIEFSNFAALHSFNQTYHENQCARDLLSLKKRYEVIVSTLDLPNDLAVDIKVASISSSLNKDELSEFERNRLSDDGCHHYAAVLVTFYYQENG